MWISNSYYICDWPRDFSALLLPLTCRRLKVTEGRPKPTWLHPLGYETNVELLRNRCRIWSGNADSRRGCRWQVTHSQPATNAPQTTLRVFREALIIFLKSRLWSLQEQMFHTEPLSPEDNARPRSCSS